MIDVPLELFEASVDSIEQSEELRRAYRGTLFRADVRKAPIKKKDLLKVLEYLQQDSSNTIQFSTASAENGVESLDPTVEESKRLDDIYLNTNIRAYDYEPALDYFLFIEPDQEVIQA